MPAVLYSQQEVKLLESLHRDAIESLRENKDGWNQSLPSRLINQPTVDGELKSISQKLLEIQASPDEPEAKIILIEMLLVRAGELKNTQIVSIADLLKKATRDGELGYTPKNYRFSIETLINCIQDALVNTLQEGLDQMESKLQEVVDDQAKSVLQNKQIKFKERLEGLNAEQQRS